MDDHAIANLSLQCSRRFMSIKGDIVTRVSASDIILPEGFSTESFLDIFARFFIWVANIGALSRGKASLDQRIRHSYLRREIIRLLEQTSIVLEDCAFGVVCSQIKYMV
jgi:hypothetical protein